MTQPDGREAVNLPVDRESTGPGGARTGGFRSSLRLLAFALGSESYALDASAISGIEPQTQITQVPSAPPWLLGVFNLRGTIVPAVDVRKLLSAPERTIDGKGLFVVFRWDGNLAALSVDGVDEIYEVAGSSLEPALPARSGQSTVLLRGQVRVRDRLIGVLDSSELVRALMGEH